MTILYADDADMTCLAVIPGRHIAPNVAKNCLMNQQSQWGIAEYTKEK